MNDKGYGLWGLVVFNSLLFIVFAVSFFLWTDLIGWKGDPHLSPFYLASYLFIGGGFWLIAAAWRILLAITGGLCVYRRLAIREELDVRAQFGVTYETYAAGTPRFLPRLRQLADGAETPLSGKAAQ